MPNIQELEPLITKTKPFFLLVELRQEPALRQRMKAFLSAYLQKIHCNLHGQQGIPLFVGIYPFGTGCCPEPVFPENLPDFDPSLLEGTHNFSPARALELLNRHLSRDSKLNFPAGSQMPTILLISDGHGTEADIRAADALAGNRWFRYSNKELLCYSPFRDRPLARHFWSGDTEPLLLPEEGALSVDSFRKTAPQSSLSVLMGSLSPDSGFLDLSSVVSDPLADLVQVDPVSSESEGEDSNPIEMGAMGDSFISAQGFIMPTDSFDDF